MGFLDRMSTVVQSKMEKIMGRMEDPRETLDLSYEKQLKLLQDVKRGVAEVTTSKKRMEMQKAKLQMNLDWTLRQETPCRRVERIWPKKPWKTRLLIRVRPSILTGRLPI